MLSCAGDWHLIFDLNLRLTHKIGAACNTQWRHQIANRWLIYYGTIVWYRLPPLLCSTKSSLGCFAHLLSAIAMTEPVP